MDKSNTHLIRRTLTVVVFLLWLISLWLIMKSRATVSAALPDVLYKVRAYSTSKNKAEEALKAGEELGLKGTRSSCKRDINKFMGYIVAQDFSSKTTGKKVGDISDLLKSRGHKSRILTDKKEKVLTIQVGGHFSSRKKAQEIAKDVYRLSTVSFDVRKNYKRVKYKAFVVVFSNIREREIAQKLKKQLNVLTSDVELITY